MRIKRRLSEDELSAILTRAIAAAEIPLEDLTFDPMDLDFDFDFDIVLDDISTTPAFTTSKAVRSYKAALPLSGTHPICIRVPARIIKAFRVQADKTGARHQTLMIRALQAAANSFV